MAQARFFSSVAQPTTLTANISNSVLSLPVAATTGFPVSYPYTVACDYGTSLEELCDVTSVSGLNLNVNRAVDGTSASAHSVGAVVRHVSSARDFNLLYTHVGSTSGVHGVTGNVVGDTDTQTLSNKTLSSPALSGTVTGSPSFSGNPAFTGTPTFSNPISLTGATLTGGTITGNWVATFQSGAVGNVPLTAKGFSGQTADIFDVQNSSAANILRVLPGGVVISNQATGTQSLVVNAISGTTVDMVDFQTNGTTTLAVQASGVIQATNAASTSEILGSLVSPNTIDSFRIRADGRFDWGPGTAARDTDLYRNGVGILQTDGQFTANNLSVTPTGTSTIMLSALVPNGYAANAIHIVKNSTGTPTIFNVDQNGAVAAGGAITGTNLTGASTTYTPTISGGALTLGNGTITGVYSIAGSMVHVQIEIVGGTTSTLASSGSLVLSLPFTQSGSINGTGNSYFTKTSGGAFNAGATSTSAGANTVTVFMLSGTTYAGFNTTNGAAVASGSLIVVDLMMNI